MLKNKSTKNKTSKESLKKPEVFIITQSNTEELKNARTATTGEKFDTLDERIDCEVDRLNKKIDITMLQQEDKENHTIENTVEGMTTDMVIKGRTLQNLASNTPAKNAGNVQIEKLLKSEMFKVGITYTISIPNRNNKPIIIVVKTKDGVTKNINLRGSENTFTVESEYPVVYRLTLHNTNGWDVNNDLVNADKAIVVEGNNVVLNSFFEGIKSFGEQEDKISISSKKYKYLYTNEEIVDLYNNMGHSNVSATLEDGMVKFPEHIGGWWNPNAVFKGKPSTKYTVQINGIAQEAYLNKLRTIRTNPDNSVVYETDSTGEFGILVKTDHFGNQKVNFIIAEGDYSSLPLEFDTTHIDKKDILLQNLGFDEGLRGLNNSVYDELNDIKNVAIKRVGKKIITSELPITLQSINVHGIANFAIPIDDLYKDRVGFCNKLILQDTLIADTITEGFTLSVGARGAFIRVKSEKASNVEEFKQYLATLNEPIVTYYPCEPIETPLDESIALKVFNEKTYVEFQNSISGTSSFKAPVNTVDTIARLNRENRALEEENKTLRQDFESTTLSLTDSDLELVKQNVDMDFRLMEVEFALDIPQAILSSNIKFKNKKGEVKSMARTPYEMMKIVILSGDYDREDYIHKVGKYYERGRMTKEEHDELMSLMTADEVISK